MLLSALSAPFCVAAEHRGGLSGTVRDEHGIPQMGAVIELIGTGRGGVRTAVTGIDGRYFFGDLLSGTYRVRATASFFRPMSTHALRVGADMESIVNLTLASIYSASVFLPAQRRTTNESSDDWMWTMRSATGRPVLRLANGPMSTTPETAPGTHHPVSVKIGVGTSSGSFGSGRVEHAIGTSFTSADQSRHMSGVASFGSSSASGDPITVGFATKKQSSAWSSLATSVRFQSDPSVRSVAGGNGWHSMRAVSTEAVSLGDTAAFEVGSLLISDSAQAGMLANRPFGRVRIFLPGEWTVEYAFATDRALQRAGDAEIVATMPGSGHSFHADARIDHGHHQAIVLARHGKTRSAELSAYRDSLGQNPVYGEGSPLALTGVLQRLALLPGALIDSSNGIFQAQGPGFTADGCRAVVTQQLTADAWLELRFADGAGLEIDPGASPVSSPKLRVDRAVSAGVTAHNRVHRTGTVLRASYQWQPERMLTPIDAFDATSTPAYLSFAVDQALPNWLSPRGTEVHISAGNVLRQGLREVNGSGQSVATLAQEQPTLQAGIGFTF